MAAIKSKEEVAELLKALGSHSTEVGEKLFIGKVKGERRSCRRCPIARYLLKHQVGPIVSVSGDGQALFIGLSMSPDLEDVRYEFSLKEYPFIEGAIDFIMDFDNGDYPSLDVLEPRFVDSSGTHS